LYRARRRLHGLGRSQLARVDGRRHDRVAAQVSAAGVEAGRLDYVSVIGGGYACVSSAFVSPPPPCSLAPPSLFPPLRQQKRRLTSIRRSRFWRRDISTAQKRTGNACARKPKPRSRRQERLRIHTQRYTACLPNSANDTAS